MEIFKLFGSIFVDTDKAEKSIQNTTQKTEKFANKLGEGISTAAKWGGAIMSAVGVASVTAVASLSKAAIDAYADYEQLVGGVETLFKDSADIVSDYAKNAYKTAGMSANEYMETVTSFSASLLQSLGGDTEEAAKKADMAITDMSDNANKMGSSVESLSVAYAGFAKGQFTLLDNLKLGYGGTQEEMKRLLADAQAISGIKYDISSYADIVDAIHVIQTEMGITGTTAKEASSTISGSIASMKGAWDNLLVALTSEDLPFADYVSAFVDSISTVAANLLPRIQVTLDGVVKLIEQLTPQLVAMIPTMLATLIPAVVSAAVAIVDAIAAALPLLIDTIVSNIPLLIDAIKTIFAAIVGVLPTLIGSLASALPTLVPLLVEGVLSMVLLLIEALPDIIIPLLDYIPDIVMAVVTTLLDNLPTLIYGVGLLIAGIVKVIPEILGAELEIVTTFASNFTTLLFTKIEEWIRALFPKSADTILAVLKEIGNYFVMMVDNIGQVLSVIVDVVATPFKLAWSGIVAVWDTVVDYFKMIWENIKLTFAVVDAVLSGDFEGAKESIKAIWANIGDFFKSTVTNIQNAFSTIPSILTSPFEKAKTAIGNIVENIKGFFKGVKLEFPNIKLPHFSIKPKGWKIDDLMKGKIPTLGIDWYAKAMRNPMIMEKPTAFGINSLGQVMAGGERGSEVVSGTETLMNMISEAVASQNSEMVYYLQGVLQILTEYFPQVVNGMDRAVVLDTGVLVGELASPMDKALGKLAVGKGRGI